MMMESEPESRRIGWGLLLAAWLWAALMIGLHTAAVRTYIETLNAIGGAEATPLRQALPARYADTQMWVRQVLAAEEAGVARLHRTDTDNAPHGREVHWSSGLAWWMRAAAKWQRATSAEGWPGALERAVGWMNAPLLLAVIVAISLWVKRRAGAVAGAVTALAIVGHKRFYEGFAPAYVDHHGLVTAAVLGLVLGVAFMGAGWWRKREGEERSGGRALPESEAAAHRAATISAVCGATGLWLSAAATLPAIALVGAAGMAVAAWGGRRAQEAGAVFAPGVWRRWGRVGGGLALAYYFIEYGPGELGWRLEVNHPLYALGWWGGAELVAGVGAWRTRGPAKAAGKNGWRWVLPVLAVVAAPAAVGVGGAAVFMVSDPFVGELRHFVAEGKTMPAAVRGSGWGAVSFDLWTALWLVPAVWLWRKAPTAERMVLGAMVLVSGAFVAMGVAEMRWWVTGSAAQIALVVVAISGAIRRWPEARWAIVAGVALVFAGTAGWRVARERAENRRQAVAEGDLMQPLYRELAAAIRATQPQGDVVLLASPNASAGVGYFGRFKTLGTLYWENAPGLRAAAEIFSATTDEEARRLLRARKVTHIALLPRANFVGEYFSLLHPGASEAEMKRSFGYRLLSRPLAEGPPWLQPVPVRLGAELAAVAGKLAVFRVVEEQDEAERLMHVAQAEIARREMRAAEAAVEQVLARVPAEARAAISEGAGGWFYDAGEDAAAVRWLRKSLAFTNDPAVANTAGWILATTSDATLRDGAAALALVEPVVRRAGDDPTVLSTWAAACAEVGRFADAVRAAERALQLVRAAGDAEATQLLQRRLEAYRAGKPWRQ